VCTSTAAPVVSSGPASARHSQLPLAMSSFSLRARQCTISDTYLSDMKKKNPRIGSSLDRFLEAEGILEETRATALKEELAWQVQKAMKRAKINKVEMARRMNTSRAALDRLLDPGNASVTLQTLCRAARAIGRDLRIELV